jgi:hypothetical protein
MDASADVFGPNAAVRGEIAGGKSGVGSAEAEVDYEVEVTPVSGFVLKVFSVPVTFVASVEASASGGPAFAYARAEASFVGSIQACGNLPDSVCRDSPTNSISGSAPPNTPISVDVFAAGAFGTIPSMFQAEADPVFAIADELIPGTNINFRDAFTLAVSPNVTQSVGSGPAAIPEPATYALLGTGLVALRFVRRRSP